MNPQQLKHDPTAPTALADDTAADLAGQIDPDLAALVPTWHRGFDGATHATPEAVERAQADALFLARRAVR